jgi:hypothetical protein
MVGEKPFEPPVATMMRLTSEQYRNSLTDVFGAELTLVNALEADETNRVYLSLGASQVGTSQRGVEQYQDAALALAEQLMAERNKLPLLSGCTPSAATDPCIKRVVSNVGLRLWRRPLLPAEVDRYAQIVSVAGTGAAELQLGMKFMLATMIQSPHFLYVAFVGEKDPDSGLQRFTNYEMASRLAYFLWNSTPDEALLQAAADGQLVTTSGISAQVDRMLKGPRARGLPARFFAESWKVSRLSLQSKDAQAFPAWSQTRLDAYQEEFRRVLEDIVFDRDADIRDVFTGKQTFASAALNDTYGLKLSGNGFEKVTLGPEYAGLLTSGAVMAANAFAQRTSPTQRGVFVREQILCDEIPAPPQDVDTGDIQNGDPSLPIRERLTEHRENPACSGCHALFDPIGLSFEAFDGMGQHRDTFAGMPIDTSGDIDGKAIANPVELAQHLREQEKTSLCMTKQLLTFATGHEMGAMQEGAIDVATKRFRENDHRFKALTMAVSTSPDFRFFATP